MKKTIKAFLLIGMIIGIIYIVGSVAFMTYSTINTIKIYNNDQQEQAAGTVAAIIFVLPMLIVAIIEFAVMLACSIICTVLNAKALKQFNHAASLEEAKKIKGKAIAGGILMLTIFPIIAAGLVSKLTEEDWEAI